MNVERIMSKTVVTVEMDDSLGMVKEIFDNTRFHHLIVVEAGKLVGVISDRDLLKALSPHLGTMSETARDTACLNKRVHQIMTRHPIVLGQNAGVFEAVAIFNHHKISCIPVVDNEHRPVGIISWRDLLKEVEAKRPPQQKAPPG